MFTTNTEAIKNSAIPILPNQPLSDTFAPILEAIGDAEIVMIGEASHGTHEFYHYRAELTKQLITQKGFTFLCCEADWPDAYRVNRYVQHGNSRDTTAEASLGDFRRFPMWMWRNTVVQEFVEWLRSYNSNATSKEQKVAFYGMDLYSFFTSMDAVIEYLEKVDPKDAKLAKKRYGNFERFQGEAKAYGQAAAFDLSSSFEKEALAMLVDLRKNEEQYLKGAGGLIDGDELFYTQVNAEIVKNAEEYYRKMYHANESTWNLRDKHMVDVVSSLLTFHKNKFPQRKEKVILWAHNSHLGDARETGKGKVRGEWNVGQLIRERFGLENTFNVGFTTYRGSVTAAKNWHKPAQCWKVRNGMFGSYEHLLHLASEQHKQFILLFRSNIPENKYINKDLISELIEERNERYIGVVYRPDTEKASHYSKKCCLPREYDCVIHVDETTALQPMDVTEPWNVEREVIAQLEDPDLWPELDGNALPKSGDVWRMVVAKKLNEIGIGLFEKKQFPYALQKFNKALQYNIDAILKCEILMNRAECHFQGGQWLSLIQDCAEILKEEPNKIQAHLLLGQAYEKVGEAKNSKHHFHLASKLAAEKPHHIEPKRRHTSY